MVAGVHGDHGLLVTVQQERNQDQEVAVILILDMEDSNVQEVTLMKQHLSALVSWKLSF